MNQWIYNKVNSLVQKYKTRDPDELIQYLNIHVQVMSSTASLLGMYKVILRNRFIFIPNNVGSLRKTVLAHELGHDQLHRLDSLNGISFHESRIFSPINRYELEANIFASHLLIPDQSVISMLKYSKSDKELADELEVDINLLNLKVSEMAKMNLLNMKDPHLKIPESGFLKHYRPQNEDWNNE